MEDEELRHKIRGSLERRKDRVRNYEEGEAFKMKVKSELYERVLTSLMEGKFYDKNGEETRNAIKELMEKCAKFDPEFPLKLASYARREMNLRSVPIFMAVEACKNPRMKRYIKKWLPSIIQRADEITEILAQYIKENGPIGDQTNVKQST